MNLDTKIAELAKTLEGKTITRRRDLHRHPETGWTEFRTASIVIETLIELGYDVKFGNDVIDEKNMMGVPSTAILEKYMQRAIAQGANPDLVAKMAGGKTGVVGTLKCKAPGPTVALRFDMDCNDINEATEEKHRPAKEAFASINPGCMHACGHDGHTSAGLAVAEILANLKEYFSGTIKLIFQPAEEGVRGAKAMAAKGIVDDVDFLLGAHLMMPPIGYLGCNVQGLLATSKFDAIFAGVPAHAGAAPQVGKNSLMAAANAAINLQAISRHSDGISRVNVGVLNAGTGRNVVPDHAVIKVETRGATSEINDYIYECAEKIINHTAAMYDNTVTIEQMGGAASAGNSPEFSSKIKCIAERIGAFNQYEDIMNVGASEDYSYFMEAVQKNGGQAAYLMIGASLTAIHHNLYFDFDEHALILEVQLLCTVVSDLLTK